MSPEQRYSRKREAVREALSQTVEHPSAEMLYVELKQKYPEISLGTVYRNLAEFCRNDEAVCVATVNGQERFDGCTKAHPHFVCEKCGEVLDVAGDIPPCVDSLLLPGTASAVSLTFYGVCNHCK